MSNTSTPPENAAKKAASKHPVALYLFLAVILASVVGAVSGTFTKELSCADLSKRTLEWKEPKLAVWSYMGGKDGYDHFAAQDGPEGVISTLISGNFKFFRVKESEIRLSRRFALTDEPSNWIVLKWGPPGEKPECM